MEIVIWKKLLNFDIILYWMECDFKLYGMMYIYIYIICNVYSEKRRVK